MSLLILILFCSCHQHTKPNPAFYYWKSIFQLKQNEKEAIQHNHCKRIYVRLFDWQWNENTNQPQLSGIMKLKNSIADSLEIVPVIYITQKCFDEKYSEEKLANQTIEMLQKYFAISKNKIPEIQLDCDWTKKSQAKYFHFLKLIKKDFKQKISATIRLHQIKYKEQTGVPPVDKGVLMFYNMGDYSQPQNENSIFNSTVAIKYLRKLNDYSLPLDVALPIFYWNIQYRNGRTIAAFKEIDNHDLSDTMNFQKQINGVYRVKKSFFLHGFYLIENDLIKHEQCDFNTTFEAKNLIFKNYHKPVENLILFDLDSINLINYQTNEIKKIFTDY